MHRFSLFAFAAVVIGLGLGLGACSATSRVVRVFPKALPKIPHIPSTEFVVGEDCGSYTFLFIRMSRTPSVVAAIEDAMQQAGSEFNGLADVRTTFRDNYFVLAGYNCVVVRGRPVFVGNKDVPDWLAPVGQEPASWQSTDWSF